METTITGDIEFRGLGFRVQGLMLRDYRDLGFEVLGFRDWGVSDFRV